MHFRLLTLLLVSLLFASGQASALTSLQSKQSSGKDWNISATASALTNWAVSQVLAYYVEISARVVSVAEDGSGCFIDAGQLDGVTVGMVFEIYRTAHGDDPGEIAGTAQIAWVREDYCFAESMGDLDLSRISTLFFARLVDIPPAVALISDTSEGGGGVDLDRLLQAIFGLFSVRRNIRPILGVPSEPAWRLTITPDFEGNTVRATLSEPGGEITGNIVIDPFTGERPPVYPWLDPSYIAGTATPFEHYLAPPGRRSVRITAGNIFPGAADELAILDGSDIWIYDLSRIEPRLLSSFSVSIPPGPVLHREDRGSLEPIDLDENGQMELCVSPPGGIRGEIWQFDGNTWVLHQYLQAPAREVDPRIGAVIIAPYLETVPAFDPAQLMWVFPTTESESSPVGAGWPVTDIAIVPGERTWLPPLVVTDTTGTLWYVDRRLEPRALDGRWGSCLKVAMNPDSPVVLITSVSVSDDILTLLDPYTGLVLAQFSMPDGPIIDLALGDIDHDGKSEILTAVLADEGVRIYF